MALTYEDLNGRKLDFLMIEVRTGLTFSELALSAGDDIEKVEWNALKARTAYDGVLRFRNRIEMSAEESEELDRMMEQLRSNLVKLREDV